MSVCVKFRLKFNYILIQYSENNCLPINVIFSYSTIAPFGNAPENRGYTTPCFMSSGKAGEEPTLVVINLKGAHRFVQNVYQGNFSLESIIQLMHICLWSTLKQISFLLIMAKLFLYMPKAINN